MQKVSTDPDEYIDSLPDNVRSDIAMLDDKISGAMAGLSRVLWKGTFWGGTQQTIIGYGDISYKRPKGNVEWFIVGLAVQKNYISIYVTGTEGEQYLPEKYADKLGRVKVGKSNINMKKAEDVDMSVLLEIVKKARLQWQ